MNINPDAGINVVVTTPDGVARVYYSKKEDQLVRKPFFQRVFSTYGKARLWAQEYEERCRKEKEKRG